MEQRLQRKKQKAARRDLMKSVGAFIYGQRQRIKSEMGTKRFMTEETRRKISLAHQGRQAWNKGLPAWNSGRRWNDEVKENISRGMVVYWIQRKGNSSNTNSTKQK